ncbi:molybdenum cofactor guanylyltransferase [PVC group bacterium]|nr:molybdenum cofactor guanylyltransferase [PVC group bacterium]
MKSQKNIKGIVLAGGHSRRFGSDKALTQWKGMSFLERSLKLLDEFSLQPVVIANRGTDYSFLGYPVYHDLIENKGPLGGLYTAMTLFKNTSLLVLTCDMPALTHSVLSGLIDKYKLQCDVTVYNSERFHLHPFPGIYESYMANQVKIRLFAKRLSMQEFLDSITTNRIDSSFTPPKFFSNINWEFELDRL